MHTVGLSKKLREAGSAVTINACHPGICKTSIARYTPLMTNGLLKLVAAPFAWFFLKTSKVLLAVAPVDVVVAAVWQRI